ncbi:MAG: alcohol dehydrogenase catalytic domain-containing protein [Sandaracinus sp.]|nr:alcohol dehydrogenase catalytic domain-containing protein [Sandaracinus sp.]
MRAWWREGGLRFGERPTPALRAPDDVRVRVMLAGLCRTDVAVAQGRLACVEPCVLGHEVAGVVEAVGSAVTRFRVGERVACLPQVDGRRLGIERDGGFAEAMVLPERALVAVPAGLDWRRAAFVEPVAACLAVRRAPLQGVVRVVGEGRIAELTRRVLYASGHADGPGPADVVVETGGSDASLRAALDEVRDGGTVVLKSRPSRALAFDVADVVVRELRLFGVGWAPFDEAFALLNEGLPVEDLLGDVSPLEAFEDLLAVDETTKRFLAPEPARCAA